MGGNGSGGARVGAGRKKKKLVDRVAAGTATRAERKEVADVKEASSSETAAARSKSVRPPRMPREQRAIWNRLAPLAIARKTLTPSTVAAFRDLCEAIDVKAKMLKQIEKDGWTYMSPLGMKAHPLVGPHRGMMQRVEAGFARFKLAPMGKDMEDAPIEKSQKSSRLLAFIGGKQEAAG